MTNIARLSATMQDILHESANRLARRCGFIQRQRRLTGATFVETLVFAWLAKPEASLEELTQCAATVGLTITPQRLNERFTEKAATFLHDLLAEATARLLRSSDVDIELLRRFRAVYLLDTSIVGLPPALARLWPGSGGKRAEAGQAALKMEVMLDLRTGALQGPFFMPGRRHDQSGQLPAQAVPRGALRLRDLGYFHLDRFEEIAAQGGFFLSRPWHGALRRDRRAL